MCLTASAPAPAQTKTDLALIWDLASARAAGLVTSDEIIARCSKLLEGKEQLKREAVALLHLRRGEAYVRVKKLDQGLKDFDSACELEPKMAHARALRALTLTAVGRFDDAVSDAKKAIALDPEFALARYALGQALLDQGLVDESRDCAKAALKIDARCALAYYLLAQASAKSKADDECLKMLNKYLELRPLPDFGEPEDLYVLRASLLLRLNRPADALENVRLAQKLNPKSVKAASYMRMCYQEMHEWNLMAIAAERLVKLDPGNAEFKVDHALASAKAGTIAEAKKALEDAIRAAPKDNIRLAAAIAAVQFLVGENEKAARAFEAVLNGDPDDIGATWGLAMMLSTCSDPKYRDAVKAVKYARQAYETDKRRFGERPIALLMLADAEAEAGNFAEAIRLARKCLEVAAPECDRSEFHRRIELFGKKQPYRYLVPE